MFMTDKQRTSGSRRNVNHVRGMAMVQTAVFGSLVGFGCLALAVDTGMQFNTRAELQRAADSGALAAAALLGRGPEGLEQARLEAAAFAAANLVRGTPAHVDPALDVDFGRASQQNGAYDFQSDVEPYNAVRVSVRRDGSDESHPRVDLLFSRAFYTGGARMSASAVAMLIPRDIALVIDLSGSMNDDSELRHYRDYESETDGSMRPGVQINLEDVWRSLPCAKGNNGVGNGVDPPPPGNPGNQNDQPGTGPGSPNSQGGNPSPGANPQPGGACGGPRWAWMTGFGNAIVHGVYTPVGDPGLYYVPRVLTCTDADVIENITTAGYSAAERTALLSTAYDGSTTYYRNRVKVLLGLAGWRSKKPGGKYNGGPGNGDNRVDTNELTHVASWPFNAGSWDDYIDYMSSTTSRMYDTDPNFRYRYGIKTVTNYLLEKRASNSACPELVAAPEMPLRSAKDAVRAMVDLINSLESDDLCSLEVFATTGRHERDLSAPADIPNILNQRQAGHYDSTTNIGAGLERARVELTSSRARDFATKVIMLLTDGKPNVGGSGLSPEAYVVDRANACRALGMTIYSVGVGHDVDTDLMAQIAELGNGEYFQADSTPDPVTGEPMYVTQLEEIFRTLGGKRPVRLIR